MCLSNVFTVQLEEISLIGFVKNTQKERSKITSNPTVSLTEIVKLSDQKTAEMLLSSVQHKITREKQHIRCFAAVNCAKNFPRLQSMANDWVFVASVWPGGALGTNLTAVSLKLSVSHTLHRST